MSIFHYYGILPSYNKKSLKKSKASKDRDIHPAICLIGTFNLPKEAQVGPWERHGAGKAESDAPPMEIDPWEEELHLDKYFLNPVEIMIINITFLENIHVLCPDPNTL